MHHPFGNALVIEMGDLFPQDEVLHQRRTARAGLQRVLVVGIFRPWLPVITSPGSTVSAAISAVFVAELEACSSVCAPPGGTCRPRPLNPELITYSPTSREKRPLPRH